VNVVSIKQRITRNRRHDILGSGAEVCNAACRFSSVVVTNTTSHRQRQYARSPSGILHHVFRIPRLLANDDASFTSELGDPQLPNPAADQLWDQQDLFLHRCYRAVLGRAPFHAGDIRQGCLANRRWSLSQSLIRYASVRPQQVSSRGWLTATSCRCECGVKPCGGSPQL
jgi:hypothetical protein